MLQIEGFRFICKRLTVGDSLYKNSTSSISVTLFHHLVQRSLLHSCRLGHETDGGFSRQWCNRNPQTKEASSTQRHPGSPTLQESVTRNRKDCGNGNNVTVLEWTAYKISLKIKRASFLNSKITLLKLFQYHLFTKWSFTIKLVSSDCFIPIIIDYNNPIIQITPLKQMVWTVMLD